MEFMASKIETTITTCICSDPELFATLKALVNGKLNIPFVDMQKDILLMKCN